MRDKILVIEKGREDLRKELVTRVIGPGDQRTDPCSVG